MHLVGYQVVCSLSNDSGTGVFLWIWRNFTEYLFYRTPLDDCFDVDPFGFPGFCSAPKIPCVISFGCYPVSSILLYISAIFSGTTSDDYFISSTLIWFIPRHLLFLESILLFLFLMMWIVVTSVLVIRSTIVLHWRCVCIKNVFEVFCYNILLSHLRSP